MSNDKSQEFSPPFDEDDADTKHEDLLSTYLDRLNKGERLDPEQILADHPDSGKALLIDLEAFVGITYNSNAPLGTLGDYTLRRQIGRGGMGVVYEAWQNSLERQVALKVLPAGIAADDKAFHRFMREAKTAAKLTHPHVVGVYGMGVEQNTPYFAMEFVEGETLAQLLAKLKEAQPETETSFGKKDSVVYFAKLAEAFGDVADGLQHAHSKGIIHRDIKPSNLILDGEGRLRILDFGLARLEGQESLTISGDVVGTPLYMSPEQARRKKIPVDHRTDVYSLGATLYEMLALRPPFSGKDHQETLSQIIERDPAEPRKVNPRVPRDLETIVLKCLRKDAADRYGTAEAMAQDLRRFVRGEVIEARPERRWERLARGVVRRRRVIFASFLILFAFACVAALGIALRQRDLELRSTRYRSVVEDAILAIELAHGGHVEWEDAPPSSRSASDVDEWFGEYQRGLLEKAVESMKGAARDLPHRPEAYYHAARALRLLRRDEDAERELRTALHHDRERVLPGLLEGDKGDVADGTSWRDRWRRLRSAKLSIGEKLQGYGDLTRELRRRGEPYPGLELELRIEQGRAALQAGAHLRAVEIFGSLHQERPEAYTTALLLARAYYLLGEREEAGRVSEESLRASEKLAEAAVAFAILHSHFGEEERCAEAIRAIPDRRLELRARWTLQSARMSREDLLAMDAELAGMSPMDPDAWALRSMLHVYDLEDPRGGAAIAEEGLRQFPRSGELHDALGWCLFYACDFEQAVAAFERGIPLAPHSSRHHNGIGFAAYRLGDLERSEAAFTESLRIYPRLIFPYYGRGKARWLRGNLAGAVDDLVRCLVLAPGHGRAALCLVQILGDGREELLEPHWAELRKALSRALGRQVKYPRLLGLLALSELQGPEPNPRAALAHAEEGLALSRGREAWILDCLAQAQQASGNTRAAMQTLERAVEWADVYPVLAQRLAAYRQSLGCDGSDAKRLLEQGVTVDGSDDESTMAQHAELLGASGRREEALRLLEERVLPRSASPSHWALWLRLAALGPALSLRTLVERCELAAPPGDARDGSLAGDVRWTLEQLEATGAVRLNCAGEDYADSVGQRWGADRFFCAGVEDARPGLCDAENTANPEVYRQQRWSHARFAYHIPVPPGRYELTLHFFEVWGKPGGQRFDVIVNDRPRLVDCVVRSPERPNDAKVERLEIDAADGLVSLTFVPKEGYVSVAGIELRRLGR